MAWNRVGPGRAGPGRAIAATAQRCCCSAVADDSEGLVAVVRTTATGSALRLIWAASCLAGAGPDIAAVAGAVVGPGYFWLRVVVGGGC